MVLFDLLSMSALLFVMCIVLIYIWFRLEYMYWERRGVIGPKPKFFEGNWTGVFLRKYHYSKVMLDLYRQYKKEPFFGIYILQTPVLVVNDLELIKNIMIKDADYFTSHGGVIENTEINVFSENIFAASGYKWKDLRVKLSPVLTSGRMKEMFHLVLESQQKLVKHLEEKYNDGGLVDFRQVLSLYTIDVISSCAFGLKGNTFTDANSDFVKYGKAIINPPFKWRLIGLLEAFMPRVLEIFKIKVQPLKVENFYKNLVLDTVKYRVENQVVRNDLMQLLIDLGQRDVGGLTDSEIVAQAFLFYVAGYETSSSAGAYAMLYLAKNPHIQDKLREEVRSVLAEGPVTYDTLQKMTYTEMVIEETLRLHPPLPALSRKCTKTYKVPNSSLVIEKGMLVFMEIQGIQSDPDFYPEPEIFKPERFSNDEKALRHKCAFMSFGKGPRLCLGQRFAMMQLKLAILGIIGNYEIKSTEETKITTDISSLTVSPEHAMVKIRKI